MNGYGSIWNKIPGLVEQLTSCIKNNWSARQTAENLSRLAGQRISKNSVIGKARRDQLPAFQSGDDGKYPRPPKKVRQVPRNITCLKPIEYEQPTPPPLPADFLGLTILDLPLNGCRYPDGNGPYLFCGQPQDGESSYCLFHRNICRQPQASKGDKPWFALRDLKSPTSPIQCKPQKMSG